MCLYTGVNPNEFSKLWTAAPGSSTPFKDTVTCALRVAKKWVNGIWVARSQTAQNASEIDSRGNNLFENRVNVDTD